MQNYLKESLKEEVKVIFIEDDPIKKSFKTKANTLAVTAVLKYENPTALAPNVLIEGYKQYTDYAKELMKDI